MGAPEGGVRGGGGQGDPAQILDPPSTSFLKLPSWLMGNKLSAYEHKLEHPPQFGSRRDQIPSCVSVQFGWWGEKFKRLC